MIPILKTGIEKFIELKTKEKENKIEEEEKKLEFDLQKLKIETSEESLHSVMDSFRVDDQSGEEGFEEMEKMEKLCLWVSFLFFSSIY